MVFTRLCGLIPLYVFAAPSPEVQVSSPSWFLLGYGLGFFLYMPTCAGASVPLEWLISTPAFHHWHHTNDGPPSLNKNYAALLPWADRPDAPNLRHRAGGAQSCNPIASRKRWHTFESRDCAHLISSSVNCDSRRSSVSAKNQSNCPMLKHSRFRTAGMPFRPHRRIANACNQSSLLFMCRSVA
jgi:hypothetical protein